MKEIRKLLKYEIPKPLLEIPQPPEKLYIQGELPSEKNIFLAVVGSRKFTSYGREACERIIEGLRGYPIVIVSGLALGIDSIAHKKALDVGLTTIAFPGSGLDPSVLYPATNARLAEKIIEAGGAVISEFEPTFRATPWSFPQRNRLMAGISKAVLVIEAQQKSGTLITARMATDYNRDVYAVPGPIFGGNSSGTNGLLKQGATPITSSEDLLIALGFEIEKQEKTQEEIYENCSPEEIAVLEILNEPKSRDELLREMNMPTAKANAILSIMEIKELIQESLGEIHRLT